MLPVIEITSTPVSCNECAVMPKRRNFYATEGGHTKLEDVVMEHPVDFLTMNKMMTTAIEAFLARIGAVSRSLSINTTRTDGEMRMVMVVQIQKPEKDPSPIMKRDVDQAEELRWLIKSVQEGARPRSCSLVLSATESQVRRQLIVTKPVPKRRSRKASAKLGPAPKKRRVDRDIDWGKLKTTSHLIDMIESRIMLCCLGFFSFASEEDETGVRDDLRSSSRSLSVYVGLLLKAFPQYKDYDRVIFLTEKEMAQFVIWHAKNRHDGDGVSDWIRRVTEDGERGGLDNEEFMGHFDTVCSEVRDLFMDTLRKFHTQDESSRILTNHGLAIIDTHDSQFPMDVVMLEDASGDS